MPGNREENKCLLRGKKEKNGARVGSNQRQDWGLTNSLNMILKDWKAFILAIN